MAKRQFLSKSDVKVLNKRLLEKKIPLEFNKKDRIELVNDEYYVKDKECILFIENEELVPTLRLLLKNENLLPEVIVDMGAIKFIVGGADIMRPGILEISSFEKDELIVIKDINNKKPLVIGRPNLSSEEMKEAKEGRVIRNIHYIGDEIWNFK